MVMGRTNLSEKVVTTLVGVPGLMSCDWFNPEGSEANTAKKDYEPIPLNAVVVKTWNNQTPPVDKQVVFVTNREVKDPFVAFDRYDDRSLMENNLFRETKQNWYLEDPPKKTREGVFVQVYMVMAMKALTKAFLMWQEEQARLDALGKETSWEMYRRKLKMLNRNKLIVFVEAYFGIFLSHEVIMLVGCSCSQDGQRTWSHPDLDLYQIHRTLSSLIHPHTCGESICGTITIFDPYIGVPGSFSIS